MHKSTSTIHYDYFNNQFQMFAMDTMTNQHKFPIKVSPPVSFMHSYLQGVGFSTHVYVSHTKPDVKYNEKHGERCFAGCDA